VWLHHCLHHAGSPRSTVLLMSVPPITAGSWVIRSICMNASSLVRLKRGSESPQVFYTQRLRSCKEEPAHETRILRDAGCRPEQAVVVSLFAFPCFCLTAAPQRVPLTCSL
jgi:hypothetical protein